MRGELQETMLQRRAARRADEHDWKIVASTALNRAGAVRTLRTLQQQLTTYLSRAVVRFARRQNGMCHDGYCAAR